MTPHAPGLSLWAVAMVQLASRPEGDAVRYWYLIAFVLLELWVCVGLVFLAIRFRQGNWGAGLIALIVWLAALGLSAVQEKRFHTLFDSQIDAGVAEQLAGRANAEKRAFEREARLAALTKPSRSVEAIKAELTGYESRRDAENFPTRIAALRAELKAAQSYEVLSAELEADRRILADTAALAADRRDAKKVGQSFTLVGFEVSAGGASHPVPPAQSPDLKTGSKTNLQPDLKPDQANWIEVERTDRLGRVRLVRVPKPKRA